MLPQLIDDDLIKIFDDKMAAEFDYLAKWKEDSWIFF